MTTLITLLGRVPREQSGYRVTRYDFGDGPLAESVAFFGWALQRRLKPERMVILGTSGSMWDHLFEADLPLGDAETEARIQLMRAVEGKQVSDANLNPLTPLLSDHLGCEVELRLIPYCRTEAEQVELIRVIGSVVPRGETVHLDITHGFRHLPMLALLAALYVRAARDAKIDAIWYGAFDEETKQATVHNLSGLLRLADALQALASFDKDGDYGAFAPLLSNGGINKPAANALQYAAYFENILNVGQATGHLRRAIRAIDSQPSTRLAPEVELLLPLIRERLDWINEDKQFEKQIRLARDALERRDYLRSVLYAFESVITRLCQQHRYAVEDYEQRELARDDYEARLRKSGATEERERYFLLRDLRNQVAHGSRGTKQEIQRILLDERELQKALMQILEAIEAGRLPSASR